MRIKIQHSSMQYTDTRQQKLEDAKVVFTGCPQVVTFTEVGKKQNQVGQTQLRRIGRAHGYEVLFPGYEGGIAVRHDFGEIIAHGYELGIKGRKGQFPNEGIIWVRVRVPNLGDMIFSTAHWAPGDKKPLNHQLNNELSEEYANLLERKSRDGRRMVFFAGDTNVGDEHDTLFPGHPNLRTVWDQLGEYPHTLARTIDVIGNQKHPRLHLVKAGVLKHDHNSDHKWIEAIYDVDPV